MSRLETQTFHGLRIGRIFVAGIVVVGTLLLLIGGNQVFAHLDADQIMVVQSPVSGHLSWYKDAGIKWRGFGTVTKYKKRSQFWFSSRKDQGRPVDESIKIRFNDGGHANISGSIAWEMPLDDNHLTAVHTAYGSQVAVEQQLVRTVVEKAVYMTGPLMSSKESYAERRNDLLQFIEDQVQNGVFRTITEQIKQPDPMTGQEKTVNVVKLVRDDRGLPVRSDESPLKTFGIKTFNPSINEIKYDEIVEAQIAAQQNAVMAVQTAVAKAREAEQAAITAEKNGQAEAAKARWEQEVIKARAITEAEQKKEVATLNALAAEQYKREQTLIGEGEGARKRAVMVANGALEQKLEAWMKVNGMYAEAVKGYQGDWVPKIVNGPSGGGGAAGSGANQMMEFLMMKTARDLGLDMSMEGKQITKGKQ